MSPFVGRFRGVALFAAALAAAALSSGILSPPGAGAAAISTITQGSASSPFTFVALPETLQLGGDDGQDLWLRTTALGRIAADSAVYASYGQGYPADPRSVQVLPGGNYLIADRDAQLVAEVTPAGDPVWTYTTADDPALRQPFWAQRVTRGGRKLTLIADRRPGCRVFAVDTAKQVQWQYGVAGDPGLGVGRLMDPFCATYTSDDTVLIADNREGNRVIEVRWSDYQAGEPDNGFTAASVVWAYGTPGVAGTEPGQVDKPRSPQLLDGGRVLIADAEASCVTEIEKATGDIVWQYGVRGEPGTSDGHLLDPNYAWRLDGGRTLIADTGGSGRVLEVRRDGSIYREWDTYSLGRPASATSTDAESEPRGVAFDAAGALVVAESGQGYDQVVTLGTAPSARADSLPLDGGQPGRRKRFIRLSWTGQTPDRTRVIVKYSLDGGPWLSLLGAFGGRKFDFPAGAVGIALAYRVTLSSPSRGASPTFTGLTIQYTKAPAGGGTGSGSGPGSGVYDFGAGGTGGSGSGTGSGGSGTGSGSGGSGSGPGGATSYVGAGDSLTTGTAGADLDAPIASTAAGSPRSVTGVQVEGVTGVSGVPLEPAGGGGSPAEDASGPSLPVVPAVLAAVAAATLLFVPWPVVAAKLRKVTGFNHARPRRQRPFWPLGR